MDLIKKFESVTCASSASIVKIDSLKTNHGYLITHVEKVGTRFGPSVLATINESEQAAVKVFIPKRYSSVFRDTEIDEINNSKIRLFLIYKGKCETTHAHILNLEFRTV